MYMEYIQSLLSLPYFFISLLSSINHHIFRIRVFIQMLHSMNLFSLIYHTRLQQQIWIDGFTSFTNCYQWHDLLTAADYNFG